MRAPVLDGGFHGIFASRHRCGPDAMDVSIVRLGKRQDITRITSGFDMFAVGTLLEEKPYVPRFDAKTFTSDGWVAERPQRRKPQGKEHAGE